MSCGGGVGAGWARGRRPGGRAGGRPARLLGRVLLPDRRLRRADRGRPRLECVPRPRRVLARPPGHGAGLGPVRAGDRPPRRGAGGGRGGAAGGAGGGPGRGGPPRGGPPPPPGCAWLAVAHGVASYYAAWAVLGLAMRASLYDAAFAALARIAGPEARRPMSQVTLLGGLASTVFWPLGEALAVRLGWRGALLAYAGLALLTVPIHLAIPAGRYRRSEHVAPAAELPARTRQDHALAAALYAAVAVLTGFLNAGISAHMIGILAGLGMAAPAAVWTSTLRGIGQSSARLGEVVFGRGLHPLDLGVLASALLPLCFLAGLLTGRSVAAGMAMALLYGAGNGLLTIVRGAAPLVLFDPMTYGTVVGRLLAPGFYLSALGPLAYAALIDRYGHLAALWASAALGLAALAASLLLRIWFKR